MVIVPATVPVCTPMFALEVVDPALIVSDAVRPPVENWMFGSSAPETGAKVSVRFTVTSTGYAAPNVTEAVDCVPGFAVAGKPVIVKAGAAGKATVRFNVSLAVSPV